MTKRLSALALATVIAMIARAASAECDYMSHAAGSHHGVVPEWSYSHIADKDGPEPFEDCAIAAEQESCEFVQGLDCARDMQLIYGSCVAAEVCDSWVQGQLEDGFLVGLDTIGSAYSGCVATVVAAGGEF